MSDYPSAVPAVLFWAVTARSLFYPEGRAGRQKLPYQGCSCSALSGKTAAAALLPDVYPVGNIMAHENFSLPHPFPSAHCNGFPLEIHLLLLLLLLYLYIQLLNWDAQNSIHAGRRWALAKASSPRFTHEGNLKGKVWPGSEVKSLGQCKSHVPGTVPRAARGAWESDRFS